VLNKREPWVGLQIVPVKAAPNGAPLSEYGLPPQRNRDDLHQNRDHPITDDVIPCLDMPAHPAPLDLGAYRDIVLERFGNPFVRDSNQRVAMDGFAKIPGFIVPTLRECIAAGRPIASTAMLPALFFAFLGRWHRGELAYAYQDGVMDTASAHAFFTAADPLRAFSRDRQLWADLAGNEITHRRPSLGRRAGLGIPSLLNGCCHASIAREC
jgi:mannitol-1-phosphate/altronate dehydrogenase